MTTSPHIAIAIDGPAASGKSTLARELAAKLGLVMVNSGAMYRAVTWKAIDAGIAPHDTPAVLDLLSRIRLDCGSDGAASTIGIDGQPLDEELRSDAVNAHVSTISAIPEVREKLVALQRDYLTRASVVMEGRDIGSVVFPDTPYKIYVDADVSVRAARRQDMGENDSIARRDAADSKRAASPLVIAPGAIRMDNSHHTIESGLQEIFDILRRQGLNVDARLAAR